ncbi:MAG: glycosyltransferase family 1 protein [Gemmataceae bacterium]|nr:glycosyltransferase family 1 protein [Gemmataceae bacterium]
MRVAIVSEVFLPKIDGVVNRTLNLIRQLPRHGDELLIVCPQAPGCDQCPVPVLDVPSFSFPLYPEYRIGLPDRRMAERLRRFAPDVMHYVNPFAFGFRCHDVLRKAGFRVPSVFSFHTLYGEFVKGYKALKPMSALIWWLMREYHNRAEVNLTVSPIMQTELTRRGFQRVELWPPAVDSDLFHPRRRDAAMRSRLLGGRTDRKLLLTVSRLAPEKNVGFLAEVVKALPGAALAIVGDGPARRDLERRFEGLDAHFVGYLKGEQLAAAYASADAFVYASETETMGNVVLEAMACGCPVVAPHAGGIPNLVAHAHTGFLFRPGDAADALHWTRVLLSDERRHAQVSQAARQAIEERNWEQSIGRVRQAYEQAIALPRAVARPTWRERTARVTMKSLVSVFRSTARRRKRRVPATPAFPVSAAQVAVGQEAFAAVS